MCDLTCPLGRATDWGTRRHAKAGGATAAIGAGLGVSAVASAREGEVRG